LSDKHVLGRIVDALELTGVETVVEIGPGRGALTEMLAARAGRVVAIELDRTLAGMLRGRYPGVTVVERDVLDVSLAEEAGTDDYVLVGNVPYYITTPILFHALRPPVARRAVFLVQREVAERVIAEPGSKTYGALSVNVQARASARIVATVPAGAFTPPPTVESAVLRVDPKAALLPAEAQDGFAAFVIAAFGLRRKQMGRVLRTVWRLDAERAVAALEAVGIDPERRPETLSPEEFAALYLRWART
jgi:16S rRNA (adenine1518-N6/adenine1519-N6)-dimethyltransferase